MLLFGFGKLCCLAADFLTCSTKSPGPVMSVFYRNIFATWPRGCVFNRIWELWQSCSIFCISIQTLNVTTRLLGNRFENKYGKTEKGFLKQMQEMFIWNIMVKRFPGEEFLSGLIMQGLITEEKRLRCDFIWFGSWAPQGTAIVSVTCSSSKDCSAVRLINCWLKKKPLDFCYSLAAVLDILWQHRQVSVTNVC